MNIMTVSLRYEEHVVAARQRARQIAQLLGFEPQDCARIATAVSEIARNAFRYAGGGEVDYLLEGERSPQIFMIRVRDRGRGIPNLGEILEGRYRSSTGMGLGLIGARRLMDQCDIQSAPSQGTTVLLKKMLPRRAPVVNGARMARVTAELATQGPVSAIEEVQEQSREMMRALDDLRDRQDELLRLNRELEDTNRGVVALYAELDEKADHLRRADQMKSRFLSNMSHEFRTPLHSISAFTKLLLDRTDGPITAEQETQLGYIRKAAEGLSEMVDDLLDLAKIEAGKVEVRPVEFYLETMFSALRGMLRPLLVGNKVALVIEPPVNMPPLQTDEQKVSQILRNFISNSIKFTRLGEVRVTAALDDAGQNVVLKVADTGIGIAPEHRQYIFEEFAQIPGPAQVGVKGTGLGLPLCLKLAKLLGGSLHVESEPGVGSTFTATIPVTYAKVDKPLATMPSPDADGPVRLPVLIVEDDHELQTYYGKILRDTGYQAVGVPNLRLAREALRKGRPAAIVLDILLQGEDSWSWLGEIKNDLGTRDIPVVVATTETDQRKGLALGANIYLEKPIARSTLIDSLDRLTGARVLVIDDDEMIRYALRKLFEPTPYWLMEASTARQGLQAALELRPQLVLLDLQLPDIRGEDVLKELKARSETAGIPVVVFTSQALTASERLLLENAADSVISKRELNRQTVDAVLAGLGAGAARGQAA